MAPDAAIEGDDLLTQSRMETWNLCRRKHHYRYTEGYDKKAPSQALDFGTAWHKFCEYWWSGRRDAETLKKHIFDRAALMMSPVELVQFEEMARGYDLAHAEDAKRYKVVALEKEFRAGLFDPSQSTRGGKKALEVSGAFLLAGKIDGVLEDTEKDDYQLVLEHKTTKQIIEDDSEPYWDKLVMDHQLSMYTVGSDALGYNVQEALYDVARKPSIRPKKGESLEEYRLRLRAEMEADPKSYFRWRTIPRQTKELFSFVRDAWDTARLMEIEKEGVLSPRNPSACFQYGTGHRCPFYDTCLGNVPLDENPELMRKAPFSELEVA